MSTEVLFSFDTEDFTTSRSADAVLLLTQVLNDEGVTGHFGLVGLLVERWLKEGRTDVIAALKNHTLGFHSYSHSIHPTLAERCDVEDHSAAAAAVEAEETKGLQLLRQAFGDQPVMGAMPPGDNVAYPALYFYAQAGIRFYLGGYLTDAENTLNDYCNLTQLPYTDYLENFLFQKDLPDLDERLKKWSSYRRIVLAHHPNMLFQPVFWDKLNYDRANLCEFGHWVESPLRTPEETATFLEGFRLLIRRLKADPRFTITDLDRLEARRQRHLAPAIDRTALPALIAELDHRWAPLQSAPYCVADVFHAAAAFLQGRERWTPGPVKGFLSEPHGVEASVTVAAEAVRQAAMGIRAGEFIPAEFLVDGQRIGPADMLFAMGAALSGGEKTIRLVPRRQTVDVGALPQLQVLNLRGKWLFSPELQDRYLSRRLRLQAWTWRQYGF